MGATDRDLNHLKNRLQTQGLIVYSVSKYGKSVTILNHQTGRTETYANDGEPEPIEIPTRSEFVDALKTIIQAEQAATHSPWVRISRLSQLFFQQHDLTPKQVVTALSRSDRSLKDFLSDYPTDFVIHQPLKFAALYISLFQEAPKTVEPSPAESVAPAAPNLTEAAPIPAFESIESLSGYLVMLLQEIMKNSHKEYVAIGDLSTAFNKSYGKPITTALKELKRSGTFVKYLQAESAFKLKRVEERWLITTAQR